MVWGKEEQTQLSMLLQSHIQMNFWESGIIYKQGQMSSWTTPSHKEILFCPNEHTSVSRSNVRDNQVILWRLPTA